MAGMRWCHDLESVELQRGQGRLGESGLLDAAFSMFLLCKLQVSHFYSKAGAFLYALPAFKFADVKPNLDNTYSQFQISTVYCLFIVFLILTSYIS